VEAQSILIIGCSSGMGLAIAKGTVDAGADVTIARRSQSRLDEARQAIAGDIAIPHCRSFGRRFREKIIFPDRLV
jgi:NAD(P)-dependent dehydrogenase (short-subunit alcohol dehydrogenase family)